MDNNQTFSDSMIENMEMAEREVISIMENREISNLEVLKDALELLSDPEKWSQGSYGTTAAGTACFGMDPRAVSFCLFGAMQRVSGEDMQYSELARDLDNRIGVGGVVGFNDSSTTTHEDIILFLKQAIYDAQ